MMEITGAKRKIMEQKKTLWIIAAVGAFLLVVLGAAVLFYKPSTSAYTKNEQFQRPSTDNSYYAQTAPVSSVTPVTPATTNETSDNNSNGFDGTTKVNDLVIVSENTNVISENTNFYNTDSNEPTTISLDKLKNELNQIYAEENNVAKNEPVVTPEEPVRYTKTTAAEAEKKEKAASVKQTSTSQSSVAKATETKKPAATKTTTTATTTKPAAKTAAKTTAVEPTQKNITRYWVQVASYTNKRTAENARSTLDTNKIIADIFTFEDKNNTLFYRVRVGPYTTKSEAEYWMAKITQINDFSKVGSYVTSTIN